MNTYDIDRLTNLIRELPDFNIIVGPALESVGVGGVDADTYAMIRMESEYLACGFWNTPLPFFESNVPIPIPAVVDAISETISSTAAYLSHLEVGFVSINESMVKVASRLLESFSKSNDLVSLHALLILVPMHDNYQALRHYGRIDRDKFVRGVLHRPWIHYDLTNELEVLLMLGTVEVIQQCGMPFVSLTPLGQEQYIQISNLLRDSGLLARRAALMRLSQFSQLEDYDELTERLGDLATARQMVLEQAGIERGMSVLELGCGTGSMTIDSGLSRLVGESGEVIATDPSFGMLARAKRKALERGINNVQFVRCRAEDLSFADNSFDAIVGCSFLHFTDIPEVMKQVHRVGKSGAPFTTYYPLDYSQSKEFLSDWFAPVWMEPDPSKRRDRLPDESKVPNAMKGLFDHVELWSHGHPIDHRHPEDVVRFFVQVGNVFESGFEDLPWQAKMDMLSHLVERGHRIVASHPPEELIQIHPHQLIRGRIVKP